MHKRFTLAAAICGVVVLASCAQPTAEQVRAQQLRAEIQENVIRPCAEDRARLTQRDPGSAMFGWKIERIMGRFYADRRVRDAQWEWESGVLRMVWGKGQSDRLEIYEANRALCEESNREAR